MALRLKHQTVSVSEFLTNHKFKIPIYQRPVSWSPQNAFELLSDIETAHQLKPTGEYFIGTPAAAEIEGSKTLEIIDGQQRLTTITLVASVAKSWLERQKSTSHLYKTLPQLTKYELDSTIQELEKCCFDPRHGSTLPRLEIDGAANDFYEEIILKSLNCFNKCARKRQELFERLKSRHSGDGIAIQAINTIHQLTTSIELAFKYQQVKPTGLTNTISQIRFFLDAVKLVPIIDDDTTDAAEKFESQNNRGLKLTRIDICRNLTFRLSSSSFRSKAIENFNSAISNLIVHDVFSAELFLKDAIRFINLENGLKAGSSTIKVKDLTTIYKETCEQLGADAVASRLKELVEQVINFLQNGLNGNNVKHFIVVQEFIGKLRYQILAFPIISVVAKSIPNSAKQELFNAIVIITSRKITLKDKDIFSSTHSGNEKSDKHFDQLGVMIYDTPHSEFNKIYKEYYPNWRNWKEFILEFQFDEKASEHSTILSFYLRLAWSYITKSIPQVRGGATLQLEHISPRSASFRRKKTATLKSELKKIRKEVNKVYKKNTAAMDTEFGIKGTLAEKYSTTVMFMQTRIHVDCSRTRRDFHKRIGNFSLIMAARNNTLSNYSFRVKYLLVPHGYQSAHQHNPFIDYILKLHGGNPRASTISHSWHKSKHFETYERWLSLMIVAALCKHTF